MRLLGVGSHDQRRARRRAAVWHGKYLLPGHPSMEPGDCRVLDVSKTGAGLELYGPWPRWAIGEEIIVRLNADDSGNGAEMRGRVRNSSRTKFGFVRAGVEFVGVSPSEQAFLRTLTERRRTRV